jgi:hypothetical protein
VIIFLEAPARLHDAMYNHGMKRLVTLVVVVIGGLFPASRTFSQLQLGTYENSFVLAPLYVEYQTIDDQGFANQVQLLKSQLPSAPYVKVGFGTYVTLNFPDVPLDQPLDASAMHSNLDSIDMIVDRARANGIIVHISLISGFFHDHNPLRYSAIRQDVRNAEWFADGFIADPSQLQDPSNLPSSVWVTPSRYAEPLRSRIEEGVRAVAQHLAQKMEQYPDTLLTISGDGEVEFTFERNFMNNATQPSNLTSIIYTDYSPFMVAEFRDWIRGTKYSGDSAPNTDDDGDGHTFDGDFHQSFTTWNLEYFDSSGQISFPQYVNLPDKLPKSGPYFISGGFDAPRQQNPGDPYWSAWIDFRKTALGDWVKDFATWVTTSPDPISGFTIPASHFYTHQIPADFIFGQSDSPRLQTSASYVQTAVVNPIGSTGVTAFNGWDGKHSFETATPELFSSLFMTSNDWGIPEYNPSLPYANNIAPNSDPQYYSAQLRSLWNFRPHLVVPFAWTDEPSFKASDIKGSVFQRALRDLVGSVGQKPWFSWRATLQ